MLSFMNPKLRKATLCTEYQFTDCIKLLRWSRDSVLAFGTQVRGFKPGRNRRIFQGEKILSAYLRHVREPESVRVEVAAFDRIYRPFLAEVVPPFTTRVSGGDPSSHLLGYAICNYL